MRRRSSFKQLSDPDPVTHRKKESFRNAQNSSRRIACGPVAPTGAHSSRRALICIPCGTTILSVALLQATAGARAHGHAEEEDDER